MRYVALVGVMVLVSACAQVVDERDGAAVVRPSVGLAATEVAVDPVERGEVGAASVTPAVREDDGPVETLRATRVEVAGVVFEGVAFDGRAQRLVVVDQAGGPGSEFADAESAARARGGMAAVNAGFFTPEGAPLGLVMAGGKKAGAWNSASSLGSGVWYEDSSGRSGISRRESLGRERAASMRDLLQAGPMLVENGRAVSSLEGLKTSVRTLVVWDGGSRWWMGRSSPCTLAACAAAISGTGPAGWKVRHALNLDGGRSADLWISGKVAGGPLTRRAAWNRPVRNFLVLLDR